MKCTSCNNGNLIPNFIDSLFRAHTCDNCGGNWVLIEDFLSWKEHNPVSDALPCPSLNIEEDISDSSKALLCPMTGSLMSKFRISANTSHRIDYSLHAGGIWLDKGEWELLKKEGIADSLNVIVTQRWQKNIQTQSTKTNFSSIYQEKFGQDVYKQAQLMREWLHNQPNKADLRAYIFAKDPYSVND